MDIQKEQENSESDAIARDYKYDQRINPLQKSRTTQYSIFRKKHQRQLISLSVTAPPTTEPIAEANAHVDPITTPTL